VQLTVYKHVGILLKNRSITKWAKIKPKVIIKRGLIMRSTLFAGCVVTIFSLAACQMNHIHDTGGGAVAPTSTVIVG